MTISYPLNTPTNIGIANIVLSAENAVAISQSPFTFQQQVVVHPGQRWAASVSLPPMKRQDAEYWIAFLLSLKGQSGTFLLGDPNCVDAQGSATVKRNLLTYTEQIDNAAWIKANASVTANAALGVDGAMTADKLVENTATGTHSAAQVYTAASGSVVTYAVRLKAAERSWVRITANTVSGANASAFFDLANGVVGSIGGGSALMVNAGSGWWWCIVTGTLTTTNPSCSILIATGSGGQSYTGDGVSGILIDGVQLEIGTTASTYQGVVAAYGPFVNGASQTGNTLVIDGCSPNITGFLLPGDYIQLGSAATTQLYKVLTQVNTDASGGATLDIWPDLRSSPADNASVVVAGTKGRFRLSGNTQPWQINEISSYGITFDCVEAI